MLVSFFKMLRCFVMDRRGAKKIHSIRSSYVIITVSLKARSHLSLAYTQNGRLIIVVTTIINLASVLVKRCGPSHIFLRCYAYFQDPLTPLSHQPSLLCSVRLTS